jgi:succinate-semialdehyde dehydrogenase/glutarate-semialdehyde dehydrogenase
MSNPNPLLRSEAFVDGAWIGADEDARFAVTDPATGATLAEVPDLGAAETERAVAAAEAAWPAWRAQTAKERAAVLRRWFDLQLEHQEELARLMTAEQGKPLAEARGEVVYGASFVEWFAEEAKRVYGDTIPAHAGDKRIVVVKQPVGVVAAITPWNFPIAMITRKCAPALAAGCPVVIKPAALTPLSALALAALAEQAGFLDGGRQDADGAVRRHGQEGVAGTRRQRAVHRLRRRRPRRRGGRRDGVEIP